MSRFLSMKTNGAPMIFLSAFIAIVFGLISLKEGVLKQVEVKTPLNKFLELSVFFLFILLTINTINRFLPPQYKQHFHILLNLILVGLLVYVSSDMSADKNKNEELKKMLTVGWIFTLVYSVMKPLQTLMGKNNEGNTKGIMSMIGVYIFAIVILMTLKFKKEVVDETTEVGKHYSKWMYIAGSLILFQMITNAGIQTATNQSVAY